MLNINVSKQLNQCIQPDETTCRKANLILDLINIKKKILFIILIYLI